MKGFFLLILKSAEAELIDDEVTEALLDHNWTFKSLANKQRLTMLPSASLFSRRLCATYKNNSLISPVTHKLKLNDLHNTR